MLAVSFSKSLGLVLQQAWRIPQAIVVATATQVRLNKPAIVTKIIAQSGKSPEESSSSSLGRGGGGGGGGERKRERIIMLSYYIII